MTKPELAARLREVFRSEATADLDALAVAFAEWRGGVPDPPAASAGKVYRLAHKIKGACRAVSYEAGQTLGFLLEHLFRALDARPRAIDARLAGDAEALQEAFTAAIRAYLEGSQFDLAPELVVRMNAVLKECGSDQQADIPASSRPVVDPRLLASFRAEASDILDVLAEILGGGGGCGDADADRALRAAHTLKGSARVVQMESVAKLAHELEDAIRACGETGGEASVLARARDLLGRISSSLQAVPAVPSVPGVAGPERPEFPPARATEDGDSFFRVERTRLKQLEASFAELLVAAPEIGSLAEEASRLDAEFSALAREEDNLRRSLGAILYRAPENRELARAATYVNFMSRQVRLMARAAARLGERTRRIESLVSKRVGQLDDDLHALQVTRASEVLDGLGGMAAGIGDELGRRVTLETAGFDIEMDRPTLQRLRGVLVHMIRNAIDHGIESAAERGSAGKPAEGRIRISLALTGGYFLVEVADDGRGLVGPEIRRNAVRAGFVDEAGASQLTDEQLHRLIFHPRFSTAREVTNLSGRGMGLSSVEEAVRALGGFITVESTRGAGTTFRLRLPASRSGSAAVLVEAGGQTYGIPARMVERVAPVSPDEILAASGRPHWSSPDGPVPIHGLAELLGLEGGGFPPGRFPAVMLRGESGSDLLAVDQLLGLRQVVVRELPPAAAATGLFAGCIPLEDGRSGLLLDVPAVLSRASGAAPLRPAAVVETRVPVSHVPVVLVVDDSYTSRTLEASVIESMGYRVLQAADGMDGLRVLRNEAVDLILCDIEMPRLDGFGMLAEVKKNERTSGIPFVLISSIEDKSIVQKGLSLGADSYIIKRFFEQDALKSTIQHYL